MVFFFSSSPYEIFSSLQYIRAKKPLWEKKNAINFGIPELSFHTFIHLHLPRNLVYMYTVCWSTFLLCYNSITEIHNGNKSLSILLSFQTKKPIMATAWSVYDRRAVWKSNQIGSGIKPKCPFKAAECDTAWHQEFDLILQLSYGWATFHLDWFDISTVWKAGWYKQGVMQTP